MDIGQRVKIQKSLDAGRMGKIVAEHTKLVPISTLQVGGDDKPIAYYSVALEDGHTNLYPKDWVVAA